MIIIFVLLSNCFVLRTRVFLTIRHHKVGLRCIVACKSEEKAKQSYVTPCPSDWIVVTSKKIKVSNIPISSMPDSNRRKKEKKKKKEKRTMC